MSLKPENLKEAAISINSSFRLSLGVVTPALAALRRPP
jgi:hypothetical protein